MVKLYEGCSQRNASWMESIITHRVGNRNNVFHIEAYKSHADHFVTPTPSPIATTPHENLPINFVCFYYPIHFRYISVDFAENFAAAAAAAVSPASSSDAAHS